MIIRRRKWQALTIVPGCAGPGVLGQVGLGSIELHVRLHGWYWVRSSSSGGSSGSSTSLLGCRLRLEQPDDQQRRSLFAGFGKQLDQRSDQCGPEPAPTPNRQHYGERAVIPQWQDRSFAVQCWRLITPIRWAGMPTPQRGDQAFSSPIFVPPIPAPIPPVSAAVEQRGLGSTGTIAPTP